MFPDLKFACFSMHFKFEKVIVSLGLCNKLKFDSLILQKRHLANPFLFVSLSTLHFWLTHRTSGHLHFLLQSIFFFFNLLFLFFFFFLQFTLAGNLKNDNFKLSSQREKRKKLIKSNRIRPIKWSLPFSQILKTALHLQIHSHHSFAHPS